MVRFWRTRRKNQNDCSIRVPCLRLLDESDWDNAEPESPDMDLWLSFSSSRGRAKASRQSDDFGLLEPGAAAKEHLTRKQMLRDWDAVRAALPEVDGQFIRETRENLKCSRALFARRLCMNERTQEFLI